MFGLFIYLHKYYKKLASTRQHGLWNM